MYAMAKNDSSIEARINAIVARTAAEIARAVRENISEEVLRVVGEAGGSRGSRRAGAAAALRGAGEARSRKASTRADKLRKGWSEADVMRVHTFIGSKPGLRSEEIGKALKIGPKPLFKILAKLRETRQVSVKGYGRGGTYTAL
jgi:hypothetical protein